MTVENSLHTAYKPSSFFRPGTTSLAILIATAFGSLPQLSRAQETRVAINIPAQPLEQALRQLGKQTGLALFFSQKIVAGQNAPAVNGSLSPDEALHRLLADTGVQFRRTGQSVSLSRNASGGNTDTPQLAPVTVTGRHDPDEAGRDKVYEKNVSSVYVGRKEIERYRIDAAGDILKGLNGVYNMNTRTAGGALTPNIRGISGKGRIPVTIDGTEQTVDVWMNNYGVGDRNYVDPSLFRSIAVDKSPDLGRGMKPGVGGSIAIRTIDANDIVTQGEKWGLMLKAEGSNNSTKPKNQLGKYLGKDYRLVGGTADGAGGGPSMDATTLNPHTLIVDTLAPPRNKRGADDFRFGGDQSFMMAGAFKTEFSEGLLAYSNRNKGNYYAGKHGADGYRNNPVYDFHDCGIACKLSTSFVPNMAKMYAPVDEVFNSNTHTETWLAKNSWNLPNGQKIDLQYMHNDIVFGEINPYQTSFVLNFSELNPFYGNRQKPPQAQNLDSHIKTDTYKLGYELKPENNRWVDLEAGIWRVKTESERHQSGGMSLGVNNPDVIHDAWYWCNVRNAVPPSVMQFGFTCTTVGSMYGFSENTTRDEIIAASKSRFGDVDRSIASGARQYTQVTRDGININNRFKLAPSFNFTVGADFQRERLDEQNTIVNSRDMFNQMGMVTGLAKLTGPRGGQRQEWGLNLLNEWQATDRLNIQAGVRYHRFWAHDETLARERANKNMFFAWGAGSKEYASGFSLPYWELASDDAAASFKTLQSLENELTRLLQERQPYDDVLAAMNSAHNQFRERYGDRRTFYHEREITKNGPSHPGRREENPKKYAVYRLVTNNIVPFRNGKPDSTRNTLSPKMFEETIANPQGSEGIYYKYLIGVDGFDSSSRNYEAYKSIPAESRRINTLDGVRLNTYLLGRTPTPKAVLNEISEQQRWAPPQKMTGEAWAPMLALTYALTDKQRLFARYAEMTRFPSLYEATSSSIDGLISKPTTPGFDLKPERSQSWEVGYAFDLSPYWASAEYSDIRVTYFSNTIKNVIDTTESRRITQYDKKIVKGLELQSRVDTGSLFGTVGATYRLKNLSCDADTAFAFDMYLQRIPACIEGGFGATRFYQSQQPKYSVNFDIGTRLLNRQLEVGMRGIYHSTVNTTQYDRLVKQGLDKIFTFTGKPYHWRPALVLDAYGRYQVNKHLTVNAGVTNLTNRFYLDPMSNVPTPSPGRTVTLGMQLQF
ncbi:TonB-dependent receptor [Alcaligenaceae bacterium]|nr:TonB-dependent receptor [Alcaligenaceae bacterium]